MKGKSPRGRLRRALRMGLLVLLAAACVYLLLEKSLTQVILDTAYARAHALAVEKMNTAVRQSLQSGAAYEDLICVRTDSEGKITMLQANTARMNALAVSVAIEAQRALEAQDSAWVSVPLGAALKAPFFSSFGPRVRVKLSPVGSVSAAFATEFEAAGINQTRHKIWLEMHASVRLVLPTGAKPVSVQTQILIAESIIVGAVPDSFINIPDADSALNFAE